MEKFLKPYEVDTQEHSSKFGQTFDLKETVTRAGQTYVRYDEIQANREDTEIYPTLEKYGNLQVMERPANEKYIDMSNALELRDLFEQEIKLKEMFESLPLEERREFNMNYYEWKEKGLEYYEKKAAKEIETIQKQRLADLEESKKPIKVIIEDEKKINFVEFWENQIIKLQKEIEQIKSGKIIFLNDDFKELEIRHREQKIKYYIDMVQRFKDYRITGEYRKPFEEKKQ